MGQRGSEFVLVVFVTNLSSNFSEKIYRNSFLSSICVKQKKPAFAGFNFIVLKFNSLSLCNEPHRYQITVKGKHYPVFDTLVFHSMLQFLNLQAID
jgi:hypothetical protein